MDSEERRVDAVEDAVAIDDSLERAGWTSISSAIRLRFREFCCDGFVFIELKAAAAAFLFDGDEDEGVEQIVFMRVMVSVEEEVVDLVNRIGGDGSSGDILFKLMLFCLIALSYGDPSESHRVSVSESE